MNRKASRVASALLSVSMAWALVPAAASYAEEAALPTMGQQPFEASAPADTQEAKAAESTSAASAVDASVTASADVAQTQTSASSIDASSVETPVASTTNDVNSVDSVADDTAENESASSDLEAVGTPATSEAASTEAETSDKTDKAGSEQAQSQLDDAAETAEGDAEQQELEQRYSDEELDALVVALAVDESNAEEKGVIATRAKASSGWTRIYGAGALDTMQKILQTRNVFAMGRGGVVIVATADGYWDALAASGLGGTLDAPVVLTSGTSLSPQSKQELARLRPDKILVMGGKLAVSDAVVTELKKMSKQVERVWGENAAETASSIYGAGKEWGKTALVATSDGYWDALSAAPYAYWAKAPIFLTNASKRLPKSAVDALARGGFTRVIIVGGPLAVPAEVEKQLSSAGVKGVVRKYGADALLTSAEFAKFSQSEGMSSTNLGVATSSGYWDALSAAPFFGELGMPLVLVSSNADFRALDNVYSFVKGALEHGYIVGGPLVVPEKVETVNEAQRRVVDACRSVPSPGPGLCAAWVSEVYNAVGMKYINENADGLVNLYCHSTDRNELKVGMMVGVVSHPHTVMGSIYGHIAIYVGDGKVMDNMGYIRTAELDWWISHYGATHDVRWGWYDNKPLV